LTPSAAPASPQGGMMYYDSTVGKFRCYQAFNNQWSDCGGGQAGPPPTQGGFPFQVKDPNGNLVLEVNQE